MDKVRFGVVGLGNIGALHAPAIAADKTGQMALAAVCDIIPQRAEKFGRELSVPLFTNAQAMFDSGLIDAAVIAVPHYWHAPLAIRAARKGIHVLCEKPLAVTVGPARAMIAQCRQHQVALGAMLQQRTRAVMVKLKELVAGGELGEVFRVQMICSSWYRTQAYYDSGAWRGTWDGEGGGVLINQAPHSLDLFQWLGGLPRRVVAVIETRVHKIEVENTVNAVCLYGEGKAGYIYATTAEAPGLEQFILCGDKATAVAEGGKIRLGKLREPISHHLMHSPGGFEMPPCDWQEAPLAAEPGGEHMNVTRAFAAHLLKGTPLVATGEEAINELELSNAIYLAGYTNKPVDLPVDAGQIGRLIGRLIRERSTGRGGNLRAAAARDLRRLGVQTP